MASRNPIKRLECQPEGLSTRLGSELFLVTFPTGLRGRGYAPRCPAPSVGLWLQSLGRRCFLMPKEGKTSDVPGQAPSPHEKKTTSLASSRGPFMLVFCTPQPNGLLILLWF